MSSTRYTVREEIAHAVTHGIGAVLCVAGLVLLVVAAVQRGDAWHVTSAAIYGATLVLLYTASTLYHSLPGERAKRLLQKFDHAAIYLLIAGTYTPFTLVTLRGPWGWSLFGVIWGLALIGVVLKLRAVGRRDVLSTVLYVVMGWLVLIALKPLVAALPGSGLGWLVAGGVCYTVGALFYLWERLPYNHAVWHVWVLGGSVCHWAAVYGYVLPRPA
ncbi:MAG: hemolysin III family protein [Opitutae bacterium]|nr:hemolysin III family protein [Opitutae bacterium]